MRGVEREGESDSVLSRDLDCRRRKSNGEADYIRAYVHNAWWQESSVDRLGQGVLNSFCEGSDVYMNS